MTKAELINAVSAATSVSKKNTEAVIKATFDTIAKALANDNKVQLVGFGTFETRKRDERIGINPLTKQTIKIAACKVPAFKAGKALKDKVNS